MRLSPFRPAWLALALVACSVQAQPVRPGVTVPERSEPRPVEVVARFEGVVLDAETRLPLPGATAQVQGWPGGASADAQGRLALDLPELPATVVVRFVGYAPGLVPLTEDDVQDGVVRRTVRLSPTSTALGEVVVTDEPPGEVLWRRVLARRQRLAVRLGAYAAEGYSRLLLTRDGVTDVRPVAISLTEAVSNLSWTRGAGLREEVVARRRLPDGGPFRWASLEPLPDLYFEDVLWLDGRPIPSPTRPDALRDYAFRLGETVEANGLRYIDLAVIPRRGGLVAGRIRVVDSLFVIAEADLRADFSPGGSVDVFDASYRWDFDPVWASDALRDSVWLPRRFDREGTVTVNLPGNRVPTVRFRQTTLLDLVLPGIRGQVASLRQRYRNPRRVYAGRETFRAGRAALPFDSLEVVANESDWIRRAELADLLKPQDGIGISLFGLTSPSANVEGEDDD
ncbi:carboxypeptidase-like regulatory domain-containing protein [Rubrivirga sp. IMCC43871]|uniref:carboxypeptidase-like regulatory domain-containing protein n=1 Tax=Rubrivirga sp. IMCC43871 TaxID=3391575 RepID=UPI003990382D